MEPDAVAVDRGNPTGKAGSTQEQQEEAFRLVLEHRAMLKAQILTVLRDLHAAEDVLSEAGIEIARSFGRYDPARPFGAWARGIARRVALAHLRERGSQPCTLRTEELEAVGARIEALAGREDLERRRRALRECLAALSEKNRRLVAMRYRDGLRGKAIAERLGRTLQSVYVSFNRIRGALMKCVRSRLGEDVS